MGKYGKSKYGKFKYGVVAEYITDRTEHDFKENNTDKIYINYWDLNRIEQGMQRIAESYGIQIITKTNWTFQEIIRNNDLSNFPTKEQMQRIINNLQAIIDAANYIPTVEVPTSFEDMDIYKMNNLEFILQEIEERSDR